MSSYLGRHAELYDLFYAEKPYSEEARFVATQLDGLGVSRAASLLDLACGTGRHAIEFSALGYKVTGVDYSADMLRQASKNVEAANAAMELHKQDMRTLSLGRKFSVVTCLFDSIGYVQTNGAVTEVLRNIHGHLADGGVAVIEFWHSAAMVKHFEPTRAREFAAEGKTVLRLSRTTLDIAKQLGHVRYSVYELRHNGSYSTLEETQTNRFFSEPEMEQLVTSAGLVPILWTGGYSTSASLGDSAWHLLCFAKKTS